MAGDSGEGQGTGQRRLPGNSGGPECLRGAGSDSPSRPPGSGFSGIVKTFLALLFGLRSSVPFITMLRCLLMDLVPLYL